MNIRLDDLHHRWLETPCRPVIIDEIPDPEPPPHPQPTDPPPTAETTPPDPQHERQDTSEDGR
jgi:hypothetical protein